MHKNINFLAKKLAIFAEKINDISIFVVTFNVLDERTKAQAPP